MSVDGAEVFIAIAASPPPASLVLAADGEEEEEHAASVATEVATIKVIESLFIADSVKLGEDPSARRRRRGRASS